MQRRVNWGRFPIRLLLSACLPLLVLPVLALPVIAQAPPTKTGSSPAQPVAQDDLPQLLLVMRRDPKATAHDEATRVALQDAALALMRNSGHYNVTAYSPSNNVIKRLLTEHAISSIDLAEPLQPAGMRHLALAMGIRTVLFLIPTFDKTELTMETQLHQNVGQDSWQIGITGELPIPYLYGKRHLTTKEVVAVTIDGLGGLLNIPSHLAADLNIKAMEAASEKAAIPKKPTKGDQAKNDPAKNDPAKTDPTTKAVQSVPPDTQPIPDKPQIAQTTPTVTPMPPVVVPPTAPVIKEPKPRTAKTDKTNPKNGEEATAATASVDDRGGRADVPTAQAVSHPNYETQADHFHDNHDLANTITYLRYAVNERPRDLPLRQKLILAYQERKMPDAAVAEILRALEISPNEGGLYRAYGETLMTRGEVPAAEKAFRDAVRLNAADIQSRIALGDALMLDNQYADALDSYLTAEKSDPRSPLPHRRLARVMLLRSAADPTQFAASLAEIAKTQELTPPNDKVTYQEDYGTLMQITESRLRELLEEVSGNFIAMTKGKQSGNDTLRALSDIQTRTDALSGYLDKVPPAVGQDATQVHFSQAATFLIQGITLFRSYVKQNDPGVKQQMEEASTDAYQELATAHKRLIEIRAAQLPNKP